MSKRFWTDAAHVEDEAGFRIVLDGKPVRLPSGTQLAVRSRALAEALAAEWQRAGGGKGGTFTAADIPLTGLAGSALDRVGPQREAMIATLAGYGETDLLCYRVDLPADLAALQAARWQPWLDWAATHLGAPLAVTASLTHLQQPPASLAALRLALERHSTEALAALGLAIPAMGSCVLGLALAEGRLSPAEALELGCLDELYQERQWGTDAEAEARRSNLAGDLALACRFVELSRH